VETATVARVIDGDTIELSDKRKVRYIGIDAPESVDPRKSIQCFGKEASEFNTTLVGGQTIQMQRDVSDTDKYGRLLRYIYLQQDQGLLFVNKYLVEQGYAQASSYPPDVKYQDVFSAAQKVAQANNVGLWKACR